MTKPFVLPQEDSWLYENSLRYFNITDLSKGPENYDAESIGQMAREVEAARFAVK